MGDETAGALRMGIIGLGTGLAAGVVAFVVAPGSLLVTAVLVLLVAAAVSYGLFRTLM